jgi:hypothetical protein
MWYASSVPNDLPEELLAAAERAVHHARHVREFHRRRSARTRPQRVADVEIAQARLAQAMKPLRRLIHQFPYGPQTETAENNRKIIREASQALQTERRKLHKMKPKGRA